LAPATKSSSGRTFGAIGWNLTREQVAQLDAASELPSAYRYWHQVQFADRNPSPIQIAKT
jgi:hypothetical protein